jgi:predicted NUDIX family phosphoesterase
VEHVLVVPRSRLFDESPHGFISLDEAPGRGGVWLAAIGAHAAFAPRSEVENDPGLKQIIPYCLLVRGANLLLLQRLSGAGERRLHHLYSIGVGGHINRVDGEPGGDVLMAAARRELAEEVTIAEGTMGVIGFVNDDTNPVGSVHFGVVFKVEVRGEAPASREPDQLAARLVPLQEVLGSFRANPATFETWSALVLSSWDRVSPIVPSVVAAVP